jgi:hypothetical protein
LRPRLSEVETAVLIDALNVRLKLAKKILLQHRDELTWNRQFKLEKAINYMEALKQRLECSLNRYARASWCTETPITDLVLAKELRLE